MLLSAAATDYYSPAPHNSRSSKHSFTWPSSHNYSEQDERKNIHTWLRFYDEWFDISPKLADFEELRSPVTGSATFVIPRELNIMMSIEMIEIKASSSRIEIINPSDCILQERQVPDSYITYQTKSKNLLEAITFDLFLLFCSKPLILTKHNQHKIYTKQFDLKYKNYTDPSKKNKNLVIFKRIPLKNNGLDNYHVSELEYWVLQKQ
jgi:hypothetical protein